MGLFPINGSTIGKALAITPNNTIDARSAWLFENQTGTLGTNLNSSVLYVGVTGDINCILSGVVGVQGTVTALDATDPYGSNPSYNALSNGSGYATANGLLTSVTSTVPKSPAKQPTGLTVDITVAFPTKTVSDGGTGYSAGAIDSVTGGTGTGIEGTVAINAGVVTAFTFTDGGTGYTVGDVITLVQAASGDNATITLVSAPNGAVTTGTIVASGEGYSIGDVITIAQAASGLNATFRVDSIRGLAPVVGDGVLFTGLQAGDILPIYVDYVLATTTTAGALVAGRESSIG